jgi:hypothetical protein
MDPKFLESLIEKIFLNRTNEVAKLMHLPPVRLVQ